MPLTTIRNVAIAVTIALALAALAALGPGARSAEPAPAPPAVAAQDEPAQKPSCRVPNLRGRSLTGAKRRLRRANCRLGRVTKPPRRVLRLRINRGQPLRVQRQTPKAGTALPNGDFVGIALVPRRDLRLARG